MQYSYLRQGTNNQRSAVPTPPHPQQSSHKDASSSAETKTLRPYAPYSARVDVDHHHRGASTTKRRRESLKPRVRPRNPTVAAARSGAPSPDPAASRAPESEPQSRCCSARNRESVSLDDGRHRARSVSV